MNYKTLIGLLRPDMAKYIVSIGFAGCAWPTEDRDAIMQARKEYNAGKIEMCQGRETNNSFALYAIPRKKPTRQRRNVFGERFYSDNHPHPNLRT